MKTEHRPPRATLPASPAFRQGPLTGHRIGPYTLMALLGEGGMGSVYFGIHEQLQRRVAIKVLKPQLAGRRQAVERFVGEARLVNRIAHPNVIEIFDIIDERDTTPPRVCLVMEFLAGQDLQANIRQFGPRKSQRALEIALQISEALRAAHAVGIVHRDLKPENIYLLSGASATPHVKVLDFGLSFGDGEEHERTAPGIIVGTPGYVAPEYGFTAHFDERSDIYQVGLILFEMLVGSPYHQQQDFEAALAVALATTDGADRVEQLVQRCLQMNPEQRFSDMTSLRDALRETIQSLRADKDALPDHRAPRVLGTSGEITMVQSATGKVLTVPTRDVPAVSSDATSSLEPKLNEDDRSLAAAEAAPPSARNTTATTTVADERIETEDAATAQATSGFRDTAKVQAIDKPPAGSVTISRSVLLIALTGIGVAGLLVGAALVLMAR